MIKIISFLLVLIPTIAFSADGVFTNLRATNARFTNFSTQAGKFHGTMSGTTVPKILVATSTLTLTPLDSILYAAPLEGSSIIYYLPLFTSTDSIYMIKNIGQGIAIITTSDGKTIDTELTLSLVPGDRSEVAKDGTNWQTF